MTTTANLIKRLLVAGGKRKASKRKAGKKKAGKKKAGKKKAGKKKASKKKASKRRQRSTAPSPKLVGFVERMRRARAAKARRR